MPRPVFRFRKFVGHKRDVQSLLRLLEGARARGEPFPPTLFIGPSGTGKTLLAESLAEQYGTTLIKADGYESAAKIAGKLIQAKHGDFVFVDEAHKLPPPVQEMLYEVIDHQRLPSEACKDNITPGEVSAEGIAVEPCTVLLATDQPGALRDALQKRMQYRVSLSHYSQQELKEIVDRMAADLNILISPQASNLIASISAGIPRRAKQHLQNLRLHFPDAEQRHIKVGQVRQFMRAHRIDLKGLGLAERKYLRLLHREKTASLQTLALSLGFDDEYISRQIEPQLRRLGFLKIGPGGRSLSAKGIQWAEKSRPAKQQEDTEWKQ